MANTKRQLSIFVNGKEVEASAKNVANAFRQASNELGKMVIGSDKYLDKLEEVKRLDAVLKQHRDSVRGVEQGWNTARGGMTNFIGVLAGAFTVDAIIGFGKELINRGAELELLDRKARVVFGETFPLVNRAAEESAQAMGLTNAEYISAAANIQDLLVPMGFARKEAAEMSTGLVDLSGALAQWSGGQKTASEVSEILSKALLGERDSLNSLGIDIKQAEVDAELLARGQAKLTGEAKKQAEAMVTLDLIMRKSTDAQAGFASGTESFAQAQGSRIATLRDAWDRFGKTVIEALRPPSELERTGRAFDEQAMKVADLEQNIVPLLGRYDELSTKTNLNADEQKELTSIIGAVGDVMPEAITGFNEYGEAIGINTSLVREFVATEKSRLEFVNQEQIKSLEIYVKNMQKWINIHRQAIEEIKAGTRESTRSMENRVKELEGFGKKLRGAEAELARLRGQNLDKLIEPKAGTGDNKTAENKPDPEAEKAAEDRAKEAAKKREQAAKDLEAHLARIQDIVKKNDEAAYLDSLSADERDLERVRMRYAKEIETVTAKFGERAEVKKAVEELELQREAELEKLREEQRFARIEAEVEAEQEDLARIEEIQTEFAEQKKEKAEEIKALTNEVLLSEREQELLALQLHYETLLAAADQYGLDTTLLKEAYAKQQADIEKKFAEKTAKEQAETQKAKLAALQASFTAFSDLASATFDFLGGESEEANEFQKVFTLSKIALDTAAAISSLAAASEANPANAVTFGGAGIAQYIAGIARIVANFAQVRKLLSSAPAVKQKAEGGFLSVSGESDGQRYRARPLSPPATGMLPGFPVVFQSTATGAPVLASERGAEYFVAAHDLRNPYVANLVRMVDNITHGRGGIPQFQAGGANPPTTTLPSPVTPPTPALDADAVRTLAAAINNLNLLLSRGVVAVVLDRTIIDINDRFKEINKASGGFFT